jgi:nitrogen PTS system EIIA component
MKLSEVLAADRVAIGLSVSSKKRALEELSGLLASGASSLVSAEVFNALIGREKLGSTGLGRGVAIPHGRIAGLTAPVAAFTRLAHAVDYDAHDGQPVDLVFGLLVPQAANEQHLKILAAIAEKFSEDDFCVRIRALDDPDSAFELIVG